MNGTGTIEPCFDSYYVQRGLRPCIGRKQDIANLGGCSLYGAVAYVMYYKSKTMENSTWTTTDIGLFSQKMQKGILC